MALKKVEQVFSCALAKIADIRAARNGVGFPATPIGGSLPSAVHPNLADASVNFTDCV